MRDKRLSPWHLLDEARKSWDYFISDEIVYQAEVRDPEGVGRQEGYVKDYIEGRLWFEVVALGLKNEVLQLVWLVEAYPGELVVAAEPKPHEPVNWRNNAMLVFVRQLAEDAEKFQFRPLRSVVWLKTFNHGLRSGGQKADSFSGKSAKDGLFVWRYIQGERDSPFLLDGQDDALVDSVLSGKCPSDVVERSPEVAKDVSDNQSPSQTDPWIDGDLIDTGALEGHARDVARKIQFALSAEGDFWLARGATNGSIEAVDVYIRPLNLEAGASKWMLWGAQSRHGSRHRRTNAEDVEGRAIPSMDAP